ncbi:DUF4139 domain-containing protein [Flavobacterium sp. J49]|uniref:DUF4139 domain-containing protein n=1 Tax=Flavobacterium sp. J49 TaxID=2718534 RepID=UPI001594B4C2|nr:DUF4139 domain-containing protein [Flavobacterium sp. J49]MBF6641628.1 DUF4139 domain-containing protein [Flavobacterium sp. J49]NIC02875.1 DUF4139 domain-containing protein [Flavobacterium sp. J49]
MKRLFLLAFWVTAVGFAQKPIFTTAKIKAATVYFNAAELSQTTSVNLPAGTSEIVIKNVADYLNESTVQIGAPSSVTVLSVQFTQNYISEYEIDETNPVIKKVRDSIALVNKEIKKIQIETYSNQQAIALLDANQNVGGANSGLNVAELMKLVDYYKTKRMEMDNIIVSLNEKETKLKAKLKNLNDKLEINTQKEDKNSRGKLIVQVMNDLAGAVNLDINYLTNSASWVPFYDLRAENITSPINMMYKAQVVQNTGIDWKKVKLTLSSGNPNQNNQAPLLSAWFLRYGNIYDDRNYRSGDLKSNMLQEVVVTQGYSAKKDKISAAAYSTVGANIVENQLNVSFDIDIPYDILSNNKPHSVALKDIQLPATYKYYAVPRVEKEAFLLAEISDYSKYNLLPGDANIIFEGLYVGKTTINPNQTSDTLNLSMGRDKKISIKREKVVDKSGTRFLSSKKEQTFTFDITIRNNKKEAAGMLLKDQYPLSPDKDIEIELTESSGAKINTETGILTWDLKLQPNETKKVRISYKVKYPKDKIIGNL